ncbi:CRISPR-associated Cse1 family protein [Salinisphaera sp. PC39]|uniref:type I-E CRISPR-associated protein Cse1/CasA n=1 Tax=Salinisphaera sp. PC39 TaxID=1304156 RepID=UPI0033425863
MNANLLLDDVFGIQLPSGERQSLSLPTLLQALGRGEVENLTGIQRHQADAFHIFLCYLAGTVLNREGESDPVQDDTFWRNGLRLLTGRDDDDAWTLVVDDPTRPAFMQPPTPSTKEFETYKPKAATPDELDVLQTAKNHDLKGARLSGATAEAWALALISMQTMSGYGGSGNYGICRMNGGYGSRPCVAYNTDLQPSHRWKEDVTRLLERLETMLCEPWPYQRNGNCLLWLISWDGKAGLGLNALHPFFIEVSRLVRLIAAGKTITAVGASAKTVRITVAKETKGNVGDPWTPIRRKDQSALNVQGRGFDPEQLRDLILANVNHQPAPMQSLSPDKGPAWFHASALARGEGTTNGYHEARIYITPKAKKLLLQHGEAQDRLGKLSDWALTRARDVRSKALRPALFALVEGGPEEWPDTNRREAGHWVDSWLARYDQHWASGYFPWLWQTINQTDDAVRAEWLSELQTQAIRVLENALQTAPQRTGRRYRGKVRATGLFHGAFRRHFDKEMSDVAS